MDDTDDDIVADAACARSAAAVHDTDEEHAALALSAARLAPLTASKDASKNGAILEFGSSTYVHSSSKYFILNVPPSMLPVTTTFVPTPPIATLCNVANKPPVCTNGMLDCHHDAKLAPETPAGQNPAVQSAAGISAYAKPAPPNAPPERRAAAHFGETPTDFPASSA
eukprot:CAMPEP_0202024570 /NCGR_PEP_ID=MMETSP0905-20130828/54417_1 /ASSEMBLY_ACC=CAM_ASM_000554 /TAXON_ID=420261 /ORGANISM="Thalassiosira antarctica, Strain CCMP982" /LENGTH=167 /DNA_ID=CAMNT_0048587241 /DNA_START=196 /DNA_END=699 /DNA_ORIENTATION=+